MANIGTIKYNNGSSWVDILHPINSFFFSYDSTSPSELFGGTWTQVTDAAIRGATGVGYIGSDTHILTSNEMPSHRHNLQLLGDILFTKGGKVNQGAGAGAWTVPNDWGGGLRIQETGGGQHTQSCNAPSTATFGIERLNKRGDGECLTLNTRPQTARGKTFSILLGRIISQMRALRPQTSLAARGRKSQTGGSCGPQPIRALVEAIRTTTGRLSGGGTTKHTLTLMPIKISHTQGLKTCRVEIFNSIITGFQDSLGNPAHLLQALSHPSEGATFGIGLLSSSLLIGGEA